MIPPSALSNSPAVTSGDNLGRFPTWPSILPSDSPTLAPSYTAQYPYVGARSGTTSYAPGALSHLIRLEGRIPTIHDIAGEPHIHQNAPSAHIQAQSFFSSTIDDVYEPRGEYGLAGDSQGYSSGPNGLDVNISLHAQPNLPAVFPPPVSRSPPFLYAVSHI